MVTETKKRTPNPAAKVAFKGAYPEDYYATVGGLFLPRVKFMKDAAKQRIASDISKATAESVAAILASSAPPPPPPPTPPIAGGVGTGDNSPMETRVANLEAFAIDTRERMARVETKLDHIEKEVSQTKWWLIGSTLTIILTVIATVIGTGIGIQQMTVTTFQAAGQQAAPPQPQPIIINVPGAAPAQPPAK